jgi:rubrerythrin
MHESSPTNRMIPVSAFNRKISREDLIERIESEVARHPELSDVVREVAADVAFDVAARVRAAIEAVEKPHRKLYRNSHDFQRLARELTVAKITDLFGEGVER